MGLLSRWWLRLVLVMASLWALSLVQSAPALAPSVRWLDHTLTAEPPDAQPVARPVTLPHTWAEDGLPRHGKGRYRSRFTVDQAVLTDADQHPWALRIDRLSNAHSIHLNGHLVHSTLVRSGWLGDPIPALIDLPGGLLQAGVNTLDIEVHGNLQGGLSLPVLAPKAELQGGFLLVQALTRTAPVVLNVVCLTFSLFVMTLWWQRRQETAAGLFGLLYLVAAARNTCYYSTDDWGLSQGQQSWLYLVAHVATACVQGWFAMAFARRPLPWFSRLLWVVLLSFPLIGLIGLHWDPLLQQVRGILQPVLLMLMLPSIWLLMTQSRGLPGSQMLTLALGIGCVLTAGVHDFVLIRVFGLLWVNYWMPWAIPMALPAFSLVVLGRVVGAFNDIEALNANLELKVAERTRELASANAAKSRFLAAASHDLRQPVAAIGLITELLRGRLQDPSSRDLTERLNHAVVSMESLLKGLLDLSRLDSGTVEVHPQRVNLQRLLGSIASHEAESARHKGLTLRVRPSLAVAWTDPVLLEQVLRNLVGNAVHHTTRGGVMVAVRQRANHLLVQVWDTGRGIAPADQARIFEEFVQLGNPGRDRRQGLGLGLAIVQRAVRLLGHELSLRSTPGRGTCFTLRVPCAPAEPGRARPLAPDTAPAQAQPGAAKHPMLTGEVMLVEDELAIRESLRRLLESWGMRVSAGPDLTWVKAQPRRDWDLLVSDHRLPDGTGRDVVQHLRLAQPDLPALIISGDTSPEQLAQLARSGLPVLHKPFRAERLRAMIDSTMARGKT
jgi:signal transduction histidine kinase